MVVDGQLNWIFKLDSLVIKLYTNIYCDMSVREGIVCVSYIPEGIEKSVSKRYE